MTKMLQRKLARFFKQNIGKQIIYQVTDPHGDVIIIRAFISSLCGQKHRKSKFLSMCQVK